MKSGKRKEQYSVSPAYSGREEREQVFWTGQVDLMQGPDVTTENPHILDIWTLTILSLYSEQTKLIARIQKVFTISRNERSKDRM